jgi:probable F420-dependent oxidoreductase
MKLGAKFPQTESGQDPGAAVAFVQAAEDLGFDYLTANEHVLGAHPEGRSAQWIGPYTHEHVIHEPLILFAFLAGVTRRIRFATSILVLPLRQAALVAKQVAELDVLSGGRVWLGVGVGWNDVEYEAMGAEFATRGHRIEEQIAVMRALWTQEVVDFDGRWHKIDRAGVKPMPIQRPIPIWMGGSSKRALDRAGRIADGWFPGGTVLDPYRRAINTARPGAALAPSVAEDWAPQIQQVLAVAEAAGRPSGSVEIGAEVSAAAIEGGKGLTAVMSHKADLGVTHLTIATQGAGLVWPDGHIDALRRVRLG